MKLILGAALAAAMALGSAAAAQPQTVRTQTDQQRIDAQRTADQTHTADRARHDRIDRLRNEERRAGHPSTHGDMSQSISVHHAAAPHAPIHKTTAHKTTAHKTTAHHHRHQVCTTRHHHKTCHWA